MILATLSVLVLSLSLVTGLPVEPDVQLLAAIDDSEVHNREVRSLTDGLGWHLDRIDQRSLPLGGKYSPIANGNCSSVCLQDIVCMGACIMCIYGVSYTMVRISGLSTQSKAKTLILLL